MAMLDTGVYGDSIKASSLHSQVDGYLTFWWLEGTQISIVIVIADLHGFQCSCQAYTTRHCTCWGLLSATCALKVSFDLFVHLTRKDLRFDDRNICLSQDKTFDSTHLGQTVFYGENLLRYTRKIIWKYSCVPILPGTRILHIDDFSVSIKWNSPFATVLSCLIKVMHCQEQ